jgi:NTP pyrophosphatase (non-canonical NTP hydrolase)
MKLFDIGAEFLILTEMTIDQFQALIREIYFVKDRERGMDGTFRWLIEEVGELARSLRSGNRSAQEEEFADVFAWLVSLANLTGIDLGKACAKYRNGCPKCHFVPCRCVENPQFGIGDKEKEDSGD